MTGNPNPMKTNNDVVGGSFADLLLWPLALIAIALGALYVMYGA